MSQVTTRCKPAFRTSLWLATAIGVGSWIVTSYAHAGCLTKPLSISSSITSITFMIARQNAVANYLAIGFTQVDCPGDLKFVRTYVNQLCRSASSASAPAPLDPALGVSLPRACADATAGLAEVTGTLR